jgi:cation diffusion facilitator family transporter
MTNRGSLVRFAWLSVAAALLTIGLKMGAYLVTGSVSLFADALESVVNIVAAIVALIALLFAARPPDEEHAYGHDKIEYFSSGVEGTLLLIAAVSICITAWERLFNPQEIDQFSLGLIISVIASAINFVVAQILLNAGRRYRSITLEADAHHLLTDVYTSVGVIVGIIAVAFTGWHILDPIIAILVALNIIWSGIQLLRRSALGLIDTALPNTERQAVTSILETFRANHGIDYHALRTRQSGARRFISVHILVPGGWSVQRGHQMLEQIERQVRNTFTAVTIFTHLEPLEDPISWHDQGLDRSDTREKVAE